MVINTSLLCNSRNYDKSERPLSAIKYIVVHYTGNSTDTAVNNARFMSREYTGVSAHYFVDDNSVYQIVPDNHAAWAVGKNYGSGNLFDKVKNYNSISIELCSTKRVITAKTQENAATLIKLLMSKYKISPDNVYRHYDVCSKLCPGWDGWYGKNAKLWEGFKDKIRTYKRTTANLNMRNRAGTTGSEILQSVKKGNEVEYLYDYVTLNGRKWYKCRYNGTDGWMSSLYLEKV